MKHLMVINHFMTMNPQVNQIKQMKKVVITGDSMLNGIHEKDMFKNHRVQVNNFPGGTSATILENIDQLVKSKPDCLTVHAGTNDLANETNPLNQAKKLFSKLKFRKIPKLYFRAL